MSKQDQDSGEKDAVSATTVQGQMELPSDLQPIMEAMREEPPRTQFSACWIQRRFRRGYVAALQDVTRLTSLGVIGKFNGPKFEYIGAPSSPKATESADVVGASSKNASERSESNNEGSAPPTRCQAEEPPTVQTPSLPASVEHVEQEKENTLEEKEA